MFGRHMMAVRSVNDELTPVHRIREHKIDQITQLILVGTIGLRFYIVAFEISRISGSLQQATMAAFSASLNRPSPANIPAGTRITFALMKPNGFRSNS